MKQIRISVVIPCYKSGEWLPNLVHQIIEAMETTGNLFEIILVNDGSPDKGKTTEEIRKICIDEERVRGFDLWKNFGQHKAICCGIDNSVGEYIIIMDDDFQHQPTMLPLLVNKIENSNYDVVIGSSNVKQPWFRRMGASFVQSLIKPGRRVEKKFRITGFVIFDGALKKHMRSNRSSEPILSTMMYSSTDNVGFIEVEAGVRISGKSGYSITKLFNSTLDNYFSLNRSPLRLIALFGFTIALFSFSYIAIIIYRFVFENRPPEGYSSLMASILFFGGSILLALGFLGEYISRILVERKGAEIYSIKDEF